MAVANGYGKTVTSGSVFMYDVGDSANSFRGEPTTNYQWNSGYEVSPSYSDWTGAPAPIDVTGTANQGPIKNAKTWKFIKNGNSNQWHGWESTYGGIWTGNAGDIWTTSYWYKTTDDAGLGGFFAGYFYKSDWSAAYNTSILANVNSIIADGQWHYNYTTTQFNENYSNAIIVDGPSWGYSTQAGELYINGLQWEKKSHPTPFAYGTRSSTQGLLPLVGNSSIDLSNISFDSNAQMTFDGTNDLIDIDTNFGTLSAYTFEYVAYSNSAANMPISSRTSTAFYKYGAYSWRYTHGGVGDEFYHTYGNDTGWAHWVITYDGSVITVYENGVSKGTKASSGTADFSGGIRIGSWASSATYTWDGQIPIMKMYNRALSFAEVRQNYNKYKTRFNLA